ncbi:TPA: type II secretion system protein GspM [Salmonella enterica subsp. enterica serovar Virchow]
MNNLALLSTLRRQWFLCMSRVDILFSHRSVRERILFIAVLFFLFFSGYFSVIIFPLEKRITAQQHQLRKIGYQVLLIRANVSHLNGFAAFLREGTSRERLLEISEETAPQYSLRITNIEEKQDAVVIQIKPMQFNMLLAWLNTLREKYGIVASEVDITAENESGEVSVRQLKIEFLYRIG